MIAVIFLLCAVLVFPLLPLLLGRAGGGRELLDASFAEQTVRAGNATLAASSLTVVYRAPGTVVARGYGAIEQIDAQWLCRAPDGSWLLGIAQGMRTLNETGPFGEEPLPIHWTWRHLDDAQAQRLVPGRIRRRVFMH